MHPIKAVVFKLNVMNSNEIKERVQELASAVGIVELTERQFVFNQLFMSYIRLNHIDSQGKTYEEIHPNIQKHYKSFESISKGYRPNKFESFLDEVNDYLMYHVRTKELTQTELQEQTRQNAYDLLEGCLGAKIIGYEDITQSDHVYIDECHQELNADEYRGRTFKQKEQTAKLSMLQSLNNNSLDSLNKMHDLLTDLKSKA